MVKHTQYGILAR